MSETPFFKTVVHIKFVVKGVFPKDLEPMLCYEVSILRSLTAYRDINGNTEFVISDQTASCVAEFVHL